MTVLSLVLTVTLTLSPISSPSSLRDFLGMVMPADEPIFRSFCVMFVYYNIIIIRAMLICACLALENGHNVGNVRRYNDRHSDS